MLFFQQLAKIGVGRTALKLAGALLRGVIGVDNLLARLASRNAGGRAHGVRERKGRVWAQPVPAGVDSKKLVHGVGEFVGVPLGMSGTALVGVANGYALH